MTRLLLFTNDYPYATGDAVFVEKEIHDLAARFDDIHVFCHARDTSSPLLELPENVTLAANLFEPAPEDRFWAPLRPPYLMDLVAAGWSELRSGRLRGHLKLFLMGARVGITQATRNAVRRSIATSDASVAYAFWGMGSGLALPWLRGVSARVVRLHGYDLYERRSPHRYLPYRRFYLRRADRILTVSEDGQRHISAEYADIAPELDIRVSRLGVPGPDAVTRRPAGSPRLIVSCSAITELKRVGLILDALLTLPGVTPERPVRWVHFGTGPGFEELEERAKRLPAGLSVDLRGQTPNDEITSFYRDTRVDVFVNASTAEGVPVSIMEAIAYGIPTVATAVGGTPEIVGEELGSGELVDADAAPEAIARTIREVLDAADSYDPRALWAERFDVRVTGPIAAELVSSTRASVAGGGRVP